MGTCAYANCESGWLHPWRSRTLPVFEGGWTCSAECTQGQMQAAVRREMEGRDRLREEYRHRIPVGLLMLDKGWISQAQLKQALEAQKQAGRGRLGHWLVAQGATNEERVARALGMQWSCPVMEPEGRGTERLAIAMPRLFVEAFGALPLRLAGGRVLYLGFEERLDPILALGVERMNGIRVESGVVPWSDFRPAHARMLKAEFAPVELVEAASERAAVMALAKAVETTRPVESKLIRVHDCLWLRMWTRLPETVVETDDTRDLSSSASLPERGAVKDMVCSISAF